jgi:uncharacterized protein YycO
MLSKAIQEVTDSVWSHIGIIYKIDSINRVLLLESVEDMGVRLAPLSKYLRDYDGINQPYNGTLAIARHTQPKTTEQIDNIVRFGMDELTRPYDRDEALKILARVILGKGKTKRDREYICSELVWECFNNAGITFDYNGKGFISPEEIWLDSQVELVSGIS